MILRLGRIQADPVLTDHGEIHVEAFGLLLYSRWGALRLLRPSQATLYRSNGRILWVPIGDITGRATLALAVAGLLLALFCEQIRTKWGHTDG